MLPTTFAAYDENQLPENRAVLQRALRCPAHFYRGAPDQHVFDATGRCACGTERGLAIRCPHCQQAFHLSDTTVDGASFVPRYLTIPLEGGIFYTGCTECWLKRAHEYLQRSSFVEYLQTRRPKTFARLCRERLAGERRTRTRTIAAWKKSGGFQQKRHADDE